MTKCDRRIGRHSASRSTLADAELLGRTPPGRALFPAGTFAQAIGL